MKKYILFLTVFLFSSCATAPRHTSVSHVPVLNAPALKAQVSKLPPSMTPAPLPQPVPVLSRRNVAHIVAPGETLAMISQMYDVPVDPIVFANHLKKAATLSPGRSLIIPQALAPRSIIPLYPNKKWKYIIVHHSATKEGDSLAFNQYHLKRGFVGGVGYDFVIDNGTLSKVDGQIEATPRWLQQQDGRHCKASHMNQKAIGVCLVGNFNEGKVSERQMAALVYLTETLCHYYRIPEKNIIGHGKVPSADTDCPGKTFPWREFNNRLRLMDMNRMMPGNKGPR